MGFPVTSSIAQAMKLPLPDWAMLENPHAMVGQSTHLPNLLVVTLAALVSIEFLDAPAAEGPLSNQAGATDSPQADLASAVHQPQAGVCRLAFGNKHIYLDIYIYIYIYFLCLYIYIYI